MYPLNLLIKFLTVVGIGILELWGAIPVGTALDLHPVLNALASALGSIIGALLVISLGDRLRNWIIKRRQKVDKHGQEKTGWIFRIWDEYGIIGLGMLSPLLTGAPLGAAIGISLGANPTRLLLWMSLGIVIWSIILTALSTIGFAGFEALRI